MFNLTDAPAKLVNLNCRVEKHGDKNVGANDIKLEVSQPNTVLNEFDPILLPYMFQPEPKNGDQTTLELGASGERFKHIRLSSLSSPKSELELPGYRVVIGSLGGFQPPIELGDCELSDFKFEGIEGGAVKIVFNASCTPSDEEVGRLRGLSVDRDVVVSLIPPTPAVVQTDPVPESEDDRRAREAKEFGDAAADAIKASERRTRRVARVGAH